MRIYLGGHPKLRARARLAAPNVAGGRLRDYGLRIRLEPELAARGFVAELGECRLLVRAATGGARPASDRLDLKLECHCRVAAPFHPPADRTLVASLRAELAGPEETRCRFATHHSRIEWAQVGRDRRGVEVVLQLASVHEDSPWDRGHGSFVRYIQAGGPETELARDEGGAANAAHPTGVNHQRTGRDPVAGGYS